MADFALQRLEKIRSSAAAIFGYLPPEKVLVEIYPDKGSFAAASTLGAELLEKSGTVGICKFNRLMILSPRNLALGYSWVDTLAHEYSHFVVNRVSQYNCPLWAHEGLARWTDTLWRSDKPLYLSDYSASRLSAAAKSGKLIAFDKMSPSLVYLPTKDDISLAFAQAASFVDFIVAEYGVKVIPEWLAEMKKSDEKRALSRVTSGSFAKIERGWRRRIASLAAPSSTGLPDLPRYELRSEEELIPSDIVRHARLGDEFRRRGNYAAALAQYERAYAAGKNPVVAVKVARAMLALGRADEAQVFIRAVSDGNRNYVTPHLVLAEIAAARLDGPSAREHYENAFMINPFHPGLYDALIKNP
jgi:tetratricopeptide (TPR) repeat protein